MNTTILFFLLIVMKIASIAQAGAPPPANVKKITILIGYLDKMAGLGHRHFSGDIFKQPLTELLLQNDFLEFELYGWYRASDNVQVQIFDSNVTCPDEVENSKDGNRRFSICEKQLAQTELLLRALPTLIENSDSFYFIGHGRKGLGLGVGPFLPEYTFSFQSNSLNLGQKPQKFFLATCKSKPYYSHYFPSLSFLGTDTDVTFFELYQLLYQELSRELTPSR